VYWPCESHCDALYLAVGLWISSPFLVYTACILLPDKGGAMNIL
jgi:hypothetical protein